MTVARIAEENTHLQKTTRWLKGIGVEIGAFTHPIEGIRPIFVDKFKEFGHQKCLADYKGDAVSLPFYSNSLDYVASSHVLEHLANPVLGLAEWYRVLKPGGMIYAVIPDKRFTFDHKRNVTTISHLLEDYVNGIDDHDGTHIMEYVEKVDWAKLLPHLSPEERDQARQQSVAAHAAALKDHLEQNIHFHTYVPETIRQLVQALRTFPKLRLNWTLVDFAERFPKERGDGILAIIRVNKTLSDRVQAIRQRFQKPSPTFPILPDAEKL